MVMGGIPIAGKLPFSSVSPLRNLTAVRSSTHGDDRFPMAELSVAAVSIPLAFPLLSKM